MGVKRSKVIFFGERMRVVGVSILADGCGNAVTAQRIAAQLERASGGAVTCTLVDVDAPALPDADVYFGIHAYRAGRLLMTTERPFVVVLGGTDVNAFVDDAHRNAFMSAVLARARAVVAFADSFAAAALRNWPFLDAARLSVILPAADVPPGLQPQTRTDDELDASALALLGDGAVRPFFLLPTALRPVKDPLFLLDAYEQWFRADAFAGAPLLLMCGPERGDDAFAARFRAAVAACSGVRFVGVLPREQLLALEHSRRCLAVLNTSESEGLANALVEAALVGAPRVARNIAGNRSVVEHGVTGFLFDTPQQCVEQLRGIWRGELDCAAIVQNAHAFIAERHSAHAEACQYLDVISRAAACAASSCPPQTAATCRAPQS